MEGNQKNYEIKTIKIAKDGKILSSYSHLDATDATDVITPPKSQKKVFGFSFSKKKEENK